MAKYARYGARAGYHSYQQGHGTRRYGRNSGFTSIDEMEMVERGIGGRDKGEAGKNVCGIVSELP